MKEETDYNTLDGHTIDGNHLVKPEPTYTKSTIVRKPLLARIISFALHPLFMVIYGVSLLFIYTDFGLMYGNQFFRFMLPVVFFSCLVPASSIFFLKKSGLIRNYSLTNKNEQLLPFLLTFLSYCMLVYSFHTAKLHTWFISLLIVPLVLTTITLIVNLFWRISTHMIGIGGLIGCTLSVCYNVKGLNPFVLFIILFILAGCLGVSRLILQRHTPAQVYISFLIGLIVSYICVWVGTFWAFIPFLFKNL